MSAPLMELRRVKFELQNLAYTLGDLNQKIKLNRKRKDLQAIRIKLIGKARELETKRAGILADIETSPYARADVADILERLAAVEVAIVHGGTQEGHDAIRALIDFLTADHERLGRIEGAAA